MSLTLYHVSVEADNKVITKEFKPRIPEVAYSIDEDCTIPRICASSSIEGCLTSINSWELTECESYGMYNVYELLRVYEFTIDDSISYITPDVLTREQLVEDATVTNEYWILENIKPTKTYLIKIKYIDSEFKQIPVYDNYNQLVGINNYYVITHVDYNVINEEDLYNIQINLDLLPSIEQSEDFIKAWQTINDLYGNSNIMLFDNNYYYTIQAKLNFYDVRYAPEDIKSLFTVIFQDWLYK